MTWWGWIIVGTVLLGAELAFVDAQFYLVFLGTAAVTVGVLSLAEPAFAPWAQWVAFAALGVLSMVLFRDRIYRRLRGHPPVVHTGPVGSSLTLPIELAPGASCQVEHRGVFWTARNAGDTTIPAGGRARISQVADLTLVVRADD